MRSLAGSITKNNIITKLIPSRHCGTDNHKSGTLSHVPRHASATHTNAMHVPETGEGCVLTARRHMDITRADNATPKE